MYKTQKDRGVNFLLERLLEIENNVLVETILIEFTKNYLPTVQDFLRDEYNPNAGHTMSTKAALLHNESFLNTRIETCEDFYAFVNKAKDDAISVFAVDSMWKAYIVYLKNFYPCFNKLKKLSHVKT